MQNKHTISFYHPKACQSETTATPLHHDPTITLALATHTQRLPITFTKNREFAMGTPPYILFLSFIYIKNVYSRREGYFGGVWMVW